MPLWSCGLYVLDALSSRSSDGEAGNLRFQLHSTAQRRRTGPGSIGGPIKADCYLRQGARPFKGTYKGELFTYFLRFFGPIWGLVGPYVPGPGP